ncbi:phage tail protein [Sphingomonas sp. SUN039]|uniref:phage tail protein n=1 Tax=Sphingomonas sp. SUN039 TaxID=2937787 RepID=UPI0021644F12|nr:tail fiber protein [Sphingomonas sp. SUN039]UVO55772.1 tail fiber protein [Sphingomonas sp. SUN039]
MSQPYVGEIRLFGGNFAPAGWGFCDGSLQAISEQETLFQLIGTTYGGDGQNTFALPDLRGRVPVHQGTLAGGSSYTIGQFAGVESVTVTTNQLPSHSHGMAATASGQQASPQGAFFATVSSTQAGANAYDVSPVSTPLVAASLLPFVGGAQPHNNIQPTLFVNYIIAFFGIFPSPN